MSKDHSGMFGSPNPAYIKQALFKTRGSQDAAEVL